MKVKYEQLYPTASYLNCRIGLETEINDVQDPTYELTRLKEITEAFHRKQFPQFYTSNQPNYLGEDQLPTIQDKDR